MDEYSFIRRLIFLREKRFCMENRDSLIKHNGNISNSKILAAARKIGGSSTNILYKNLFISLRENYGKNIGKLMKRNGIFLIFKHTLNKQTFFHPSTFLFPSPFDQTTSSPTFSREINSWLRSCRARTRR